MPSVLASRDHEGQAKRRGEELREAFPQAISAHYDRKSGRVVINLSSKLTLSFSPHDAQGLEDAKPSELEEIEITPSGFGIHFPRLDADLYVPGLLEGFLGSTKWMAARMGQMGGQSRSRAKKAASRANGRLGEGRRRRQGAREIFRSEKAGSKKAASLQADGSFLVELRSAGGQECPPHTGRNSG